MFVILKLCFAAAFGILYVSAFQYTTFPLGYHSFFGNVKCANGNPIADHAVVMLRERDDFSGVDDVDKSEITADPNAIKSGMFQLEVPKDYTDEPTNDLELYLEFWNVCKEGEEKMSGFLKDNWWVEYVIDENEIYAQPRDPQKKL